MASVFSVFLWYLPAFVGIATVYKCIFGGFGWRPFVAFGIWVRYNFLVK